MPEQTLAQQPQLEQHLSQEMVRKLTVLQTATADLQTLVEQEVTQNPLLELAEPEEEEEREGNEVAATAQETARDAPANNPDDDWERFLPHDREWRHVPAAPSAEAQEWHDRQMAALTKESSLTEHIVGQVALLEIDESEADDLVKLLGYLNENGWLERPLEEIAAKEGLPVARMQRAQKRLLALDPPGIGAVDLRECLMVQLQRDGKEDSIEYQMLDKHFGELARRRFDTVADALDVEMEEVRDAARRITALNPRPARDFDARPEDGLGVLPELTIERQGDHWGIQFHRELTPTLRISSAYKSMMADSPSDEVRDFIRGQIKKGRFFISLLEQRQQTIQKVANLIVARQGEFLRSGLAALRPMTMTELAGEIGVHETTISRAVAGKYANTPHGVMALRDFFTSGMPTSSGDSVSSRGIEAALKSIIDAEDKEHPLLDTQIAEELAKRGIRISRRTVVKYREKLGILASALRKGR